MLSSRYTRLSRIAAVAAVLPMVMMFDTGSAEAQSAPTALHETDYRPLVVGIGAIAGVVIFNWAALGAEALPGGFAYAAGSTVPAEMSVAMSRVYATTSAVAGALIAYYGYGR